MISTFHGLETMRRALSTQQAALYTTGHNIANANTPGYSRQRVNFTQTEAFPNPAFNKPGIPGQLGTGVKAGEIQRIRDSFLDLQFRGENAKLGYWSTKYAALERMEDVMNELDNGNAKVINQFWQALEDVSANPEDAGARAVLQQRGVAVAEAFNHTYESIETIQRDYRDQIGVENSRVNSLLNQINEINKQIASVEVHGLLPNDLYDKRDLLVDELSQFMNIEVERVPSGGNAKEMAEGRYTIHLLDNNGQRLNDIVLLDGSTFEYNEVSVTDADGGQLDGPVTEILIGGTAIAFEDFNSNGSLKAMIEAYGYMEGGEVKGIYNEMMQNLDTMISVFVEEFNNVHSSGWSLSEIEAGEKANGGAGYNFFEFADPHGGGVQGSAKYLKVSEAILSSTDNIAAAREVLDENGNPTAYAGDGSNALNLANVKATQLNYGGQTASLDSFYQGVIGRMAVGVSEASNMTSNFQSLANSINERRQAVSSVSLDEELANMIQFQHAYNAAARNMTAVDEMLDTIINGMGRVGR
ncbi:flagellar hook-associated protein FlgK [Salipaludibacillus agaradhaerens]|uniref:Flagellar hook-associated protein 1 n=1 Tax=Salipaludibacillus agaradhaerens TaxID=76935 RepID=A0A9Q4AXW4_SALAG|nr:flagellar hook-associated protein FlgK [Salipaludibacillus agaradhaerens]MCR6095061.1 flagellar hook-associated protein FlgK [Salipaludibacillus agaradhaerens]MCR6115381.1 flagellar hook-associated protein FlgK [Salipaludibacillus agaradhaerens]